MTEETGESSCRSSGSECEVSPSLLESSWLLSVELSSSSQVLRYSHPPCWCHRCLNPRKDIWIPTAKQATCGRSEVLLFLSLLSFQLHDFPNHGDWDWNHQSGLLNACLLPTLLFLIILEGWKRILIYIFGVLVLVKPQVFGRWKKLRLVFRGFTKYQLTLSSVTRCLGYPAWWAVCGPHYFLVEVNKPKLCDKIPLSESPGLSDRVLDSGTGQTSLRKEV